VRWITGCHRLAIADGGLNRVSPHRTFLDDLSRLWNAWDVIPVWGERRTTERRIPAPHGDARTTERRVRERRRTRGLRIALPPRLARGWIAFEHFDERRRVAPIPHGWSDLPESGLRELWRDAEQLPPRRRRLVE
jgi:hypothetical protein